MGFFKTSRTDILAFRTNSESSFNKSANFNKTASFFQNEGISVDIQASLDMVADEYKLSKNPDDYIFVISRALTVGVPNENNDCFPKEELLRFDTANGHRVFQSFINKPNHINHRADDPKQARGVILDAHYNNLNTDDEFIEILVAVDKTKDKRLAEGIQTKQIDSMSMGCFAEECECSICGHTASSVDELCPDHIRGGRKGKMFGGKQSYENCYKVTFQEESWVDDPADPTALVSEIMNIKASLDSEHKKELAHESELFLLNTRLARMEKMLSNKINNKTASVSKEAQEIEKSISDLVSDLSSIKNAPMEKGEAEDMLKETTKKWMEINKDKIRVDDIFGAVGLIVNQVKHKGLGSVNTIVDYLLGGRLASDINNDKENTNKENQMSVENPYGKLAKTKKAKGGGKSSEWTSIDSGKGTTPKEWSTPGKQVTQAAPSEWKFAFLSKMAVDDKAKEYWTKYYKDGYGSDLIKDIKRKRIASSTSISLEQMKILEPKFAELMESQKIDAIQAGSIIKMSELFADSDLLNKAISEGKGDTSGSKWEDTEGYKAVSEGSGDSADKKWTSIDAARKAGNLTLDLFNDGWHLKEGDSSLMIIENSDEMEVEEFEGDEFGQGIIAFITEHGAEKTAKQYKVAKYPAVGNDPSTIDEIDQKDDIRDKSLRDEPKGGVEEEGTKDLAVPEAPVDGVEGDGPSDMPALKEAGKKKKKKEDEEEEKEAGKKKKKKDEDEEEDEKKAKKKKKDEDEEEDEKKEKKKGSVEEEIEAGKKKKDEDEEEDEKKEAGVLEYAEDDIKGDVRSEPSKGIMTSTGTDVSDMAGIERATTQGDKISDDGNSDLEGGRGKVVQTASKETAEFDIKAFKQDYAVRYKKALSVAVKRANLNMINNELKATMFDMLTQESDLPDGEVYTGMDDGLAAHLVEESFNIGASKFFGNMLSEAARYAAMSEDAFLEIEADVNDLSPILHKFDIASPDKFDIEPSREEAVSLAEEAMNSNPVFKSTASALDIPSTGKYGGLKGLFGTANVTAALAKVRKKTSFLG